MKKLAYLSLAFLVLSWGLTAAATPSVDALLEQQVGANPLGLTPVVITFDHTPTADDFAALKALGIPGGVVVSQLPMVLTAVNQAQLAALKAKSGVLSLYANRTMKLFTNVSRTFIGVKALWKDQEVTAANGGMPVSGQGIGVAYVDTGIDATHPDLQLGRNVVQNVFFPLAEVPLNFPSDFVPQVAVEDVPHTDVEGGHGTFGAAVLAGTGAASGAFYGGVAPGAKLVGLVAGNDAGLSTFAILQAFGYALANQFRYNIRVCNNSWGTTLADTPCDPLDPINVATRIMHDRNITVVFAAGNAGDTPGAINPYSVAPWVISVAAGEKEGFGTPASFSSRGEDNGTGTDTPGQPADPWAPPNLRPDITGSGVDIKSARAKAPGVTNLAGTIPLFVGANDLNTIAPAFLPFYTTSQGTSFASPQVAGVVALMLEANPTLTPDQVVTILRQTATPMPYEERVVGAGYVDAHNAVRAAMALAAVPHPANLFPGPDSPEILDPAGDQLGTRAQDIRAADFAYDATQGQLVYTLTLQDLSSLTPNSRWTLSSNFGSVTVFVTAAIGETGSRTFSYGRITTLPTGTRNQQTLGSADAGEFRGNQIVIRLGLAKVSAAAGFDVLHTLSTAPEAISQILIGTSFTGGLLLTSDRATGRDFWVGKPIPPPDPGPEQEVTSRPIHERFAGALEPNQPGVVFAVNVKKPSFAAKLTTRPGNAAVNLELLDQQGQVLATSQQAGPPLVVENLAAGTYWLRVTGTVEEAVDFVIHTHQKDTSN
ncbi:MAG: S8 family serine peptidase [Acidobacteriota bacterium]